MQLSAADFRMPDHPREYFSFNDFFCKFFFLKDFSPLADRRQKEKFINRKSSGQPARKIYVVE